MQISKTFRYSLRRGDSGHDVWALQINLNHFGNRIAEDGVFGVTTETVVKAFQAHRNLTVDGIAGPLTQRIMALALARDPEQAHNLPPGLLKGLIEGESGYFVGCVNWSVPGGVDCGWIQDRVYTKEMTDGRFHNAFDGPISFDATAVKIRTQKDKYKGQSGAKTDLLAWKYAILFHNWEVAADHWAQGDYNFTYTALDENNKPRQYKMNDPAHWVEIIGVPNVRTGTEWANFYIRSKIQYITVWPL